MEEDLDTKRLVRIYSFHAEERLSATSHDQTLGRVLSSSEPSLKDIAAPWRIFYEPWESQDPTKDPITKTLSIEAGKLQKQWLSFRQSSSKAEQVNFNKTAPTMGGVIKAVTELGKEWDDKRRSGNRGRAKGYFHRLCGTMDAHSNMLEVLPHGSEYVCLFAGTITSIMKASVNHEGIAEDIAQALCEIGEHVADCETELRLFHTEDMQNAVADLYAHIFLFLTDTLCWYGKSKRKRVMDSFNEKFRDELGESIENIKKMSMAIKRKAENGSAAEQRVTRLTTEAIGKDIRVGLEGFRREQAEMKHLVQQAHKQLENQRAEWQKERTNWGALYGKVNRFLDDNASAQASRRNVPLLLQSQVPLSGAIEGTPNNTDTVGFMTKEELLVNSADLETLFHRDRVRLDGIDLSSVMVEPQALAYVAAWTQSENAQILCVAGPLFEGYELESPMTMLAAKFIDFASTSKVPTISYFCELRRREELIDDNDKETQGFLQMVYGLIRQMIELTLPEMQIDKDLCLSRFSRLDGTADSWEDAMSIFTDIRDLLPGKVFCVIDGLQWLDNRRTSNFLTQFVDLLREGNMKVLLATIGESRSLLRVLAKSELLLLGGPSFGRNRSLWMFEEAALTL